jgi:hypothetical protein
MARNHIGILRAGIRQASSTISLEIAKKRALRKENAALRRRFL